MTRTLKILECDYQGNSGSDWHQETGVAILVRRKGEPIAFFMRSAAPQSEVSSEQLSDWITQECSERFVAATIQENLMALTALNSIDRDYPSVTIAIYIRFG
jgi:hypothetical protein